MDDATNPEAENENDPLTLALAVLGADDRRRFGEDIEALIQAVDARAEAGMSSATATVAARHVAEAKRAANDPTWAAWSAVVDRARALERRE